MVKKRVVIKIGSSNLVSNNRIDEEKINRLAEIISKYKIQNTEFIIVTSGAVAAGRQKLDILSKGVTNIRQKQALAAIGQPYLMRKYKESFEQKNLSVAQVLLTGEDLSNRKRYINIRETIFEILNFDVIPIINENDTVSNAEIKIGDNDNLSARIAAATDADILIILSDIDGLYDKNPKEYDDAVLVPVVDKITKKIIDSAGGAGSSVGTGGMITKIEAAKVCMKFGIEMRLINGKNIDNIEKILSGEHIGTKFCSEESVKSRKKMWIAFNTKTKGAVFIDDGAEKALKNGKSLLSGGIYKVSGKFNIGDAVTINNSKNEVIAKGLINYTSYETDKIKGSKSTEIERILGYKYQEEIIHRDNMLLTEEV